MTKNRDDPEPFEVFMSRMHAQLLASMGVPAELMAEDPKHMTSGWAKERKMRGL